MDRKRRHHHVWQEYLRAWERGSGVFCLQDGRIYKTGTTTLAIERDFYRFPKPNAEDVQIIRAFMNGSTTPRLGNFHDQALNLLLTPMDWLESLKSKTSKREYIDQALEKYQSNILEDLHSTIESAFLPILKRALKGDTSFYKNQKERGIFLIFLATQYMRTIGPKVHAIRWFQESTGRDLKGIWSFLCQQLAVRLAVNLESEWERRNLLLLQNETNVPFVTGDQPLVNMLSNDEEGIPTRFAIYYPLSPKLALILDDVRSNHDPALTPLTPDKANELNAMMFRLSFRQVFGESQEALLPLQTLSRRPKKNPTR